MLTSDPAGPKKIRVGGTQFLEATPWHLYVGAERVDEYLQNRGLGWVVSLREELQQGDFRALELNYTGLGRPAYHPRLLLGLLVYGVLTRKSSLREFEELAVADVGAWWICGGQQPDHRTVSDFLVRHQEQLTTEFFVALVRDLVGRKGMQHGLVAGDGTVIEASASRFALLNEEAAAQAAEQAQATAAQQPTDAAAAQQAQQAQTVARLADERASERARKGRSGAQPARVVTPHEPEAVVQRCKDGRCRPAYKPSVLVHESGVIVAQAVPPSSESAVVSELFDQHEDVFGTPPRAALLDAGYHNSEVLGEAVDRAIDLRCPSGSTQGGQWQRHGTNGKFGTSQFPSPLEFDFGPAFTTDSCVGMTVATPTPQSGFSHRLYVPTCSRATCCPSAPGTAKGSSPWRCRTKSNAAPLAGHARHFTRTPDTFRWVSTEFRGRHRHRARNGLTARTVP